ncbi:MAG: ferredoxin [Roseateles depolymerans]|uniref:Ferredoxin n=1 Tax=Roseateles depolymerans TaxID=76731 RepID=A0A2W5DXF8_9BURK|nr:MAG: ferredoxin [Roseateles depolymerans]
MPDTDTPDLPLVFQVHAFGCMQARPPGHPRGSCAERGAKALVERLQMRVDRERLPGVAVTMTGCMGFCQAGPLMVVYPQGVWYAPRNEADVDEIVDRHFRGGQLVERLVVLPRV